MTQSAPVDFSVNGKPVQCKIDPETMLVYFLRNDLKLKGTRYGCGTGHCGSCTVLIDDLPVQSCSTPLWSVTGKQIQTIEGLGSPDTPHPVQSAFIEEQAAQCGYCINGMVMSLAGLLKKTCHPSDEQLLQALDRHLCRCGTHMRILNAARRAIAHIQGATV